MVESPKAGARYTVGFGCILCLEYGQGKGMANPFGRRMLGLGQLYNLSFCILANLDLSHGSHFVPTVISDRNIVLFQNVK